MKKISTFSFVFALALFLGATPTQASVISLSPQAVSVSSGQTVSLTISVDSEGASLSTVESKITYPANLLTPTSFTLAPAWTALTEPGYDQMANGMVIKTAGYPHGFSGVQAFGTLTFRAIGTGTAALAVDGSSIAYSTSGQNTVAGTQGSAAVSISAAPVVIATPTPAAGNGTTTVTQGTTPAPAATPGTTPTTAANIPLGANAAGAGGFHMPAWAWILSIILLIGLIAGGRYAYGRRQKTVVVTTPTQK